MKIKTKLTLNKYLRYIATSWIIAFVVVGMTYGAFKVYAWISSAGRGL